MECFILLHQPTHLRAMNSSLPVASRLMLKPKRNWIPLFPFLHTPSKMFFCAPLPLFPCLNLKKQNSFQFYFTLLWYYDGRNHLYHHKDPPSDLWGLKEMKWLQLLLLCPLSHAVPWRLGPWVKMALSLKKINHALSTACCRSSVPVMDFASCLKLCLLFIEPKWLPKLPWRTLCPMSISWKNCHCQTNNHVLSPLHHPCFIRYGICKMKYLLTCLRPPSE